MRRTLIALLAAFAVVLVAVGGVATADGIDSIEGPTSSESTAEDSEQIGEGSQTNESDADTEVGVCVVGVDSPCNGDSAMENGSERIDSGDGEDEQIWIPEDQNRDGEIDERFKGDGEDSEVGICVTGVDSPCNGDSATENGSEQIDSGDGEDQSEQIGSSDGEDGQIWIPEDQNSDGLIDERFRPQQFWGQTLLSTLLGLF